MKVTLVYPSMLPGEKPQYGLPPMGILYIGAELKRHGYDVEILDADIEGLTVKETVDRILLGEPDLVGFSLMTPQLPSTLQACFWLKQIQPELPIVLGGAHIASTITDVFSMADCFDFVVNGEGEVTMVEVCKQMEKGDLPDCLAGIPGVIYKDASGMIVTNPSRAFWKELDELAPIDYSMVDLMTYKIPTLPGPRWRVS